MKEIQVSECDVIIRFNCSICIIEIEKQTNNLMMYVCKIETFHPQGS